MNVFEAMEAGDCLCIALNVRRSEAAISDPSKLVIKQIIPNYISADSFIEAAKFAVGNDPEASGGFGKEEQ